MSFLKKGSRRGERAPLASDSTRSAPRSGKYGSSSARQERRHHGHGPSRVGDLVNSTGYQGVSDVPGAPNDRRWYHGGISDHEAQLRLKDMEGVGNRGVYLVFDNPDNRAQYILMLLKDKLIFRWHITRRSSDNKYVVGDDNVLSRGHSSVRKFKNINYHDVIRFKTGEFCQTLN